MKLCRGSCTPRAAYSIPSLALICAVRPNVRVMLAFKVMTTTFRSVHRRDVQILDEGYVSGYWCKVVGTAGGYLMIELRDGSRVDGWFEHVTRWRRKREVTVHVS